MSLRRIYLCSAALLSCAPATSDTGVSEFVGAEAQTKLNAATASLTVYIEPSVAFCGTAPSICIGSGSSCYSLSTCYTGACLPTSGATCTVASELAADHPFVTYPDDWDHPYLQNNSTTNSLQVDAFTLGVMYSEGTATGAYDFVDKAWGSPVVISASGTYSLDTEVAEKREDDLLAHTTVGSLEELPRIVQYAAQDIGQIGIVKYRPWDSGAQNGCDEFYNYFASLHSNNIAYDCTDCGFFTGATSNGSWNALSLSQWVAADRAHVIDFTAAGTNRGTIDGVYPCTDYACSTWDTSAHYTAKPGDYLIYVDTDEDGDGVARADDQNFHVMMLLDDIAPTITVQFSAEVLEKGTAVKVGTRTFGASHVNKKLNNGDFRYHYYIGKADVDVDPDGTGSLDAGGAVPAIGPNGTLTDALIIAIAQP